MNSSALDPIPVLVIDDDSQLLRTLSDILGRRGYEPHVAASATEGLAIAERETVPAIALVDLRLPDMDGLEVVRRLRAISALTEMVILTGHASVDSAVSALREQSHDYLLKPVAPEQLLVTLGRASERWRRRHVEETLRQAEERAHLLLENISDVVAVIDAGGSVTYASASVTRNLGYSVAEIEGRGQMDLLHPDSRAHVREFVANAMPEPGATGSIEVKVRHRDGSWRTLECHVTNLCDRPAIGGYLLTARDVTTARALERQLLHAQKMESVGNLAGGIAHDFNNLLTAVIGYSDLILKGSVLDEQTRTDIEEIQRAGERAAALTRQLLAFSRQQPTAPGVVDLNGLLKDLSRMLRRLIGEQIELESRLASRLRPVLADPTHLEQVVMNLVVNARDAMPDGGRLSIETENVEVTVRVDEGPPPGRHVRLSVIDTGMGMSDAVRAKAFEPFFSTKEPGKGTGLGLSTCYGILQQAGGAIAIESTPGQGTAIHTYWPCPPEGAPSDPERGWGPVGRRGTESILVVDDDEGVRRLAATILRAQGYHVLLATDAGEAMEAATATGVQLDLVLTDVVLTGLDGRRLAGQLRERFPRLRVLFMSGYERPIGGPPASPLLLKPFTAASLTEEVGRVLQK